MSEPARSSRLTAAIGSENACDEVRSKLLIQSDGLSNVTITEALGRPPDRSVEKGFVHRSRFTTKVRVQGFNMWMMSSEPHVTSLDLRDHLDWLIACLNERRGALFWLQRQAGISMYVSCVCWPSGVHGGPVLWPEQMRGLAELNLECGFDIYFMG